VPFWPPKYINEQTLVVREKPEGSAESPTPDVAVMASNEDAEKS
jgi:hypothetical protein